MYLGVDGYIITKLFNLFLLKLLTNQKYLWYNINVNS